MYLEAHEVIGNTEIDMCYTTSFMSLFSLPDHTAYDKMKKVLTAESLKKGIMQASPMAQTDCLEGFHSVLNLFAPKLIAYSFVGMYCR